MRRGDKDEANWMQRAVHDPSPERERGGMVGTRSAMVACRYSVEP